MGGIGVTQLKITERNNPRQLEEELKVLYSSIQQAVEVAGKDGTIQYVNPYFCRLTGISPYERIGKNIFEIAPESALARVLRTHEPIYAHRSHMDECDLEIIANAHPVIIAGEIEAGIAVFQPLTEVSKLKEEIEASQKNIEELTLRLDQLSRNYYTFDDILGSHPDFVFVRNKARRAAGTNTPILLLGEPGTGKEIFAHAIHGSSLRSQKPFMKVDCADIPESRLEIELMGSETVSAEGTIEYKLGKLEGANGGTLFLDEVGTLNESFQQKLYQILRDKFFYRVGGTTKIDLDVRIITSTNRDLSEMVEKGLFHEQLYNLLAGIKITLPPLRHHKEDVLTYAQSFIYKANRKLGKNVLGITTHGEQLLLDYHWPGNIQELKSVIEMAMYSVEGDMLHVKDFASLIEIVNNADEINYREPMALDELEKHMIRLALERYGNSVEGKKRAASVLNISLATLYNKLKIIEDQT